MPTKLPIKVLKKNMIILIDQQFFNISEMNFFKVYFYLTKFLFLKFQQRLSCL